MDAVPGMPTKFWFTATKTTQQMRQELSNPNFNFELACTELCGKGHFSMRYVLVVDSKEDYEAWYKAQTPWSQTNSEYILANLSEDLKASFPAAPVAEEKASGTQEAVPATDSTAAAAADTTK
jgi:cytochrome c oxidase subunit 2